MYSFSERLRDLRIETGYKQEEMAKKLNVTTSAYGYYEQGRNEPSFETLRKIAKTFHVSTDYLLGLIDVPIHPVQFKVTSELSLSESQLIFIEKMKEIKLLDELSEQPNENIERLNRYWEFIKSEHKSN